MRSKFSLNLFIGTCVALLLPMLVLTVSKCTIRKRFVPKKEDGTKQRINLRTPKQEQIIVWISCLVGVVVMVLVLLRVFG